MAHGRNAESQLATASSAVESDKIRFIQGGLSKQITIEDTAAAMDAALVALGFQKAGASNTGIYTPLLVRELSGNGSILLTDAVIWADMGTAGGDIGYSLPTAASAFDIPNSFGQSFSLKLMVPSGTRKLTISAQPGDLIDEAATFILQGPSSVGVTVISNGADWIILGG